MLPSALTDPADVVRVVMEFDGRPPIVTEDPTIIARCVDLLRPQPDDGVLGILTNSGVRLTLRSRREVFWHRNSVVRWGDIWRAISEA